MKLIYLTRQREREFISYEIAMFKKNKKKNKKN